MSLVVTCPSCGQPTPVDLTRSRAASANSTADRAGPRCANCGADVSGALGPADADTALDSYAPFGTAVMKRPNVEAILAGHAAPEIADVNPDILPLGARASSPRGDAAKLSSPLTLASTVLAPAPSLLENTLQSRHDAVAYAEQLRARLPNVDVVSPLQQPAPDTIDASLAQPPAPALGGPAQPPPGVAQAGAPPYLAGHPAPQFQLPMQAHNSAPQRAGLIWSVALVALLLGFGLLAAVLAFLLLGRS